MSIIPSPGEVGKEAVILIAGAVLAALIMSQFPELKKWIRAQWN